MAFAPHPILAIGIVATAPSPAVSGTTLVLQTGHGARFGAGGFPCIVEPAYALPDPTNAECFTLNAGGVSGDTLTITRAQESTTARSIQVGDIVYAAVTPALLAAIEARTVQVGTEMMCPTSTIPTGYLWEDGSAVSRVTYADLFAYLVKAATVTTPIASPGIVGDTAHGRSVGDPISFAGAGLPTGITAGTTYYIQAVSDADHYKIAATLGGSAINFTGTSTGTQTRTYAPYGIGDGTTTFNLPDRRGRFPKGADPTGAHGTANTAGQTAAAATHQHASTGLTIATHTHLITDHTHTIGVHFHAAGSHTHPVSSHAHGPGSFIARVSAFATGSAVYVDRIADSWGASVKFTATGGAVASSSTTNTFSAGVYGQTDTVTPTTSASAGNTGNSGAFSTTGIDGGAPQTGNNSAGGVSGSSDATTAPDPVNGVTYFIIKT